MRKILIGLFGFALFSSCVDDRKDCSDSFATIIFVQEDINGLLKNRKSYDLSDPKLSFLEAKTDTLLLFFDNYENALFKTLKLERPNQYDFDWCMSLEHNDHFETLTKKLVGEPCELVKGKYTVNDLYNHLNDYNNMIDSLTNTSYCNDNPYFNWLIDPEAEKCMKESERFYSMNLNNHLIAILRLKEAILNQEIVIREKIKNVAQQAV